jgi:hypothetical protein
VLIPTYLLKYSSQFREAFFDFFYKIKLQNKNLFESGVILYIPDEDQLDKFIMRNFIFFRKNFNK